MKDLPVYDLIFDEENPECGLNYISLVTKGAIGVTSLAFKAIEETDEKVDPQYKFKFNSEQRILAGPAMIPDKLLFRKDDNIGEFYVKATKSEIAKFFKHFNQTTKEYKINFDHDEIVKSASVQGSWLIESELYDKSRYYGFNDLPVGTYFVEIYIDDQEEWDSIVKNGGRKDFSVEGFFGLEVKFNKQIKNEKMNKLKFAEAKLADGTTIYTSGLEIGAEVYVIDENLDKVPVFDGEHELADGSVVVTVDGKITEYKPKAEAEAMAEVAVEAAEVIPAPVEVIAPAELDPNKVLEIVAPKLEEIYAAIAELKTMLETSKETPEVEVELKKEKFERVDSLKAYFNATK